MRLISVFNNDRLSPGTRSSTTHSGSRRYNRDDEERYSPNSKIELQCNRQQAECQSDGFQLSQAEFRKHPERSNAEGAEVRSLYEETRAANASIAPDVTRLRAREEQLVTDVSTLPNRDTELHENLRNLRQKNALINARMNRNQITNTSMNQQLLTSIIDSGSLQAEVSDLRNSVGKKSVHRKSRRSRSSKFKGAKILRVMKIFGIRPRLIN